MYYISEQEIETIESLKNEGLFNEALKKVNYILSKDPTNEEALLQVSDIEYRRGEIDKAAKAIDFLNDKKGNQDVMGLYVKGVLEMEKNQRYTAKKYFQTALKLSKFENGEIVRCYGLCEYWYGNREKGIDFIEQAFQMNKFDAEVVYNLIELYLLEYRYQKAKKMILYFYKNREKLESFDKEISFYDDKIGLFKNFISSYIKKEK